MSEIISGAVCDYCGKEIIKIKKWKRFCNNLCRQKKWQEDNPRIREDNPRTKLVISDTLGY